MEQKYIIDSNILIDAEAQELPLDGMTFLKKIIDEDFIISFVTYIEILGYKKVTKSAQEFVSLAHVIEINKRIIDECIKIRKSRSIKLPDAIIASTAMANNYTLVTHNVSDFMGISGLKIIDPYNL